MADERTLKRLIASAHGACSTRTSCLVMISNNRALDLNFPTLAISLKT